MAKTTAWAFTILGVLSIPPIMEWINTMTSGGNLWWWLFALIFLVVGVTKLMRNYSKR